MIHYYKNGNSTAKCLGYLSFSVFSCPQDLVKGKNYTEQELIVPHVELLVIGKIFSGKRSGNKL